MSQFYEKFEFLKETECDGFIFAEITDHFHFTENKTETTRGDGVIRTPKNQYISISWRLWEEPIAALRVMPTDEKTGYADLAFTLPIQTMEDLSMNVKSIIPLLKAELNENKDL